MIQQTAPDEEVVLGTRSPGFWRSLSCWGGMDRVLEKLKTARQLSVDHRKINQSASW
jgi:hypothetical protein